MKTCKYIKAAEAFIYINVAEAQGVEYIDRLAHAVRLMDLDESVLEVFDGLWENECAMKQMINVLEKEQI